MSITVSFLHLVLVGIVTLFAPINPIGTALIMDPLLTGSTFAERKAISRRIAMYCFLISVVTIFAGTWIFSIFGVSLPVVQIAGGIIICRMGWQLLSPEHSIKKAKEAAKPEEGSGHIEQYAFYPLAFPMTTGAGTISVLLTLSAHDESMSFVNRLGDLSALVVAIFVMCIVIYLSYAYTAAIVRRLGSRAEQIVNRLSAFLVFCVGIQIGFGGIAHYMK
ncbi:MAG TPA: MarC family protein [Candidatus Kapabacteria bacterium]|nr:MarC family protein [Candidatus Kapabacteria bacterium]